jgi:hypothetical protein
MTYGYPPLTDEILTPKRRDAYIRIVSLFPAQAGVTR